MQESESPSAATLEIQITERCGLLLSQTQLAELLGHTTGSLRCSLSYPCDHQTRALKACGRKIGNRVYHPANEVAKSSLGTARHEQDHHPCARRHRFVIIDQRTIEDSSLRTRSCRRCRQHLDHSRARVSDVLEQSTCGGILR